ncbi:MAG: GspH/FimT family pseudopilin [Rhizobacter sp.]|nr:GspH/FimT family pseudopilin [Rhizobacter sp.]
MGTTSIAAWRGFTLIELAATVAVASIVMTAAVPSLNRWVDDQRLNGVAGELASDLQYARSEAVLRNEAVRVSFHGDAEHRQCYLVHTGAADQCHCGDDLPAHCDGEAQALKVVMLDPESPLRLVSNAASVLFAPEHGTASPAALVRVIGRHEHAVQHVVNIMGRVRSCSPLALVSGYRAC